MTNQQIVGYTNSYTTCMSSVVFCSNVKATDFFYLHTH